MLQLSKADAADSEPEMHHHRDYLHYVTID